MPILTTTLWKQISSRTQGSGKKASVICKMSFFSLFSKASLTLKEDGVWHHWVIGNKCIVFLLRCCGGNLSKGMVMMLTCIMVNKKGIVFGTGTLLGVASTEYRIIYSMWISDVKPQVTTVKWLEAGCGLGMLKGNYVTTVNTFHWLQTGTVRLVKIRKTHSRQFLYWNLSNVTFSPFWPQEWQAFEKHGWTFG